MSDVPYVRLVDSLVVRRLIVEDSAELPGGAVAAGFVYACTGSENPDGFVVAFPSGLQVPATYVATVQYFSSTGFVIAATNPASWLATQIGVICSQQPVSGDMLTVIIAPTP